jgi:hypothetical protein
MMRSCYVAAALALAAVVSVFSGRAAAAPVVVADYQDNFQTPSPAPGWSYLTNTAGPLGNPANYTPLAYNGTAGQYQGGTGGQVVAGRGPEDPLAFPPSPIGPYPQTFVRPGPGILQDTAERAAIVAYTVQPQDVIAAGATPGGKIDLFITAYDFTIATTSADGMSARIYHDTDPTPVIDFSADTTPPFPFPPGFRFETSLDPRPIPLGTYAAGQTVYVALGSNATDIGDEIRLDFTLSATPAVPEPATATLVLAPLALGLLARRRGR